MEYFHTYFYNRNWRSIQFCYKTLCNKLLDNMKYRELTLKEIEQLQSRSCRAEDWSAVMVANGWIYWVKVAGSDWHYINLKVLKKGVDKYQTPADELYSAWSADYRTSPPTILIPIKKGYKYETHYNATGATVNFRFIYAEGSK